MSEEPRATSMTTLNLGAVSLPPQRVCPDCKAAGQKSKIKVLGASRTLMATFDGYDEDGNYVHHDPNKTTTAFACSNGHRWSETT